MKLSIIVAVLLFEALVVGVKAVTPTTIQCATRGGGRRYTGHPWGIAVRNPAGEIMSKIRLDESVRQLSFCDGQLYASSMNGLFAVDPKTAEIRRIALRDHLSVRDGIDQRGNVPISSDGICWQAVCNQCLWAGNGEYIYKILLQDRTIQSFDATDLGIKTWIGGWGWDFGLALDDGLWVEGHTCISRLPHGKGSAESRFYTGGMIIGVEASAVWCLVGFEDFGCRPCRIDRATGQTTTYYFGGSSDADRVDWDRSWSSQMIGRNSSGDLVFNAGDGINAVLRNGILQKVDTALQMTPFKSKRFRSISGKLRTIADVGSSDASFLSDDDVSQISSEKDASDSGAKKKRYEWMPLQPILSPATQWDADPRMQIACTGDDATRLKWVDDANAHLRCCVIANLGKVDHAILSKALDDPFPDVREAAVCRLFDDKSPGATVLLRRALENQHPPVRFYATFALLKRGEVPATRHVRFAAAQGGYTWIDRGRKNDGAGGDGFRVSEGEFRDALAQVSDSESIAVVQELRTTVSPSDGCFRDFGRRLAMKPEGISRLTDGTKLQEMEGPFAKGEFARRVAVEAGPAMLPIMHAWLADQDFLRRMFAANVCGRIGDKSSLEPLLKALEHDDGLALGAVVEALGRLKLAPALQPLTELYLKVDQDIGSRLILSGIMPVWCRDPALGETNVLGERTHIWKDAPRGCSPVSPRAIVDAIVMIGPDPEPVQSFFRELHHKAFSEDAVARCLRPGKEPGNTENIRILSELVKSTGDKKPGLTAYAAAVSLLRFGRRDGDAVILHHLSDYEMSYYSMQKLEQLLGVSHDKRAHLDVRLRELYGNKRSFGSRSLAMMNELLKP